MTMKKRFLGLALAAAVALPATTAYAAGSATITGKDDTPLSHTIAVTGAVSTNEGIAPEGTLTVELPTAMSFMVDKRGELTGGNYTVTNQSAVGIKVSVSDFKVSKGNITVNEAATFNPTAKDRSNVTLSLDGRTNGISKSVDLHSFLGETSASEVDILDVSAKNSGTLNLTGEAGTKPSDDQATGVDAKGATGEFSLVFKIKKQ